MSTRVLDLATATALLAAHEADHEADGAERPCLECGPLTLLHDRAAEAFGVAHAPLIAGQWSDDTAAHPAAGCGRAAHEKRA